MPRTTSSRTRKRSSGSSCATWRTPLKLRDGGELLELRFAARARRGPPSPRRRAMNGCCSASSSRKRVSSRLCDACTAMQPAKPAPAAAARGPPAGSRASGSPSRSSIQPWVSGAVAPEVLVGVEAHGVRLVLWKTSSMSAHQAPGRRPSSGTCMGSMMSHHSRMRGAARQLLHAGLVLVLGAHVLVVGEELARGSGRSSSCGCRPSRCAFSISGQIFTW